uniref:Uncharacterized protein n=1 Tax=Physcomitrium patens TaxID=3218 RepID=A0A2K1JZA8_PHYPA|nr:hypothetical protein PHYPA_013982 [Physcomitrium patens]
MDRMKTFSLLQKQSTTYCNNLEFTLLAMVSGVCSCSSILFKYTKWDRLRYVHTSLTRSSMTEDLGNQVDSANRFLFDFSHRNGSTRVLNLLQDEDGCALHINKSHSPSEYSSHNNALKNANHFTFSISPHENLFF